MTDEIDEILSIYKDEIDELKQNDTHSSINVERGIQISRKYLQELRVVIRNGKFKNKEDEIKFFKKQKPLIYSRLKFYTKLYIFRTHKPLGSVKYQRAYIDKEIKKLQAYYIQNIDFVNYYRENETVLDEFYFVRGKDSLALISDTSHFYTDAEFSTSHDNAVAKIIAYDLLLAYYVEELNLLNKGNGFSRKHFKLKMFNWSASKTDLVELIYALHTANVINEGKVDIKEMATMCEKLFNIKIGDYYRIYLEIRSRKINQTKFLDKLKESLIAKMKNADE